MGSTLPTPSGSAYKVQVSSVANRRHYPPHSVHPTSRSRTIFSRPMSLETDWTIPQPDWIAFPHVIDSFGFLLGTSKPLLASEKIPTSRKFDLPYHKESTVFRKPNLHTQLYLNCHMSTYISPEPQMILMLELVLLSPLLSFQLSTTWIPGIPELQSLSLTQDLTAVRFLLYTLPPRLRVKDLISKENINFGNAFTPF